MSIIDQAQRLPFLQPVPQMAGMPMQPNPAPSLLPPQGQAPGQAPPQGQGQGGPSISPDMIMKIMSMFAG